MKYVWLVGRPQGNPDFPYLSQVHLEHGVVKDESDTELTGDPDADEDAALG